MQNALSSVLQTRFVIPILLINAAIEGIKNKIEPPAATEENLFDEAIAKQTTLTALPKSLTEAKRLALNSEFIKAVLGPVL